MTEKSKNRWPFKESDIEEMYWVRVRIHEIIKVLIQRANGPDKFNELKLRKVMIDGTKDLEIGDILPLDEKKCRLMFKLHEEPGKYLPPDDTIKTKPSLPVTYRGIQQIKKSLDTLGLIDANCPEGKFGIQAPLSWWPFLDYAYERIAKKKHPSEGLFGRPPPSREVPPVIGLPRQLATSTNVKNFITDYLGSKQAAVPFEAREDELGKLNTWLSSDTTDPFLALLGTTGSGKTALLIDWLKSIHGDDEKSLKWTAVFVPIGARTGVTHQEQYCEVITDHIKHVLGVAALEPLVRSTHYYSDLLRLQFEEIAATGRKFLLVLDAIDETMAATKADNPYHLSFLPKTLPPSLRVAVSARTFVDDDGPENWKVRLGWEDSSVHVIEIKPFDRDGVRRVIEAFGKSYAKLAADLPLLSRLAELSEGNALTLKQYIRDLGPKIEHGARITAADLNSLEPGFYAYFERWYSYQVALWEAEGTIPADADCILAIFAYAFGRLESADILTLVETTFFRPTILSPRHCLHPLRRFIAGTGEKNNGYIFNHAMYRDCFRRFFAKRATFVQTGFIRWLQSHLRAVNATDANCLPTVPAYVVENLGQHFEEADVSIEEWMELVENGWRRTWTLTKIGIPGFTRDVQRAQEAVVTLRLEDKSTDLNMIVAAQWRCALILASDLSTVQTLGENLPDELVCISVSEGILAVEQARRLADFGRSRRGAISLLVKLAELRTVRAEEKIDLLSRALEIALSIANISKQSEALAEITFHHPGFSRAKRHMAELLKKVLNLIDDGTGKIERLQAMALVALAPAVDAPNQIRRIFDIALLFRDRELPAEVLVALAPKLRPEQAEKMFGIALRTKYVPRRIRMLVAVAPRLHSPLSARIALTHAQEAVTRISNKPELLVPALLDITQLMSTREEIDATLQNAMNVVKTLDNDVLRTGLLVQTASRIASDNQLEQALLVAEDIVDNYCRVWATITIACKTPSLLRIQQTISSAIAQAVTFSDELDRAGILGQVAPAISSEEHVEELLAAALSINSTFLRAGVLGKVASALRTPRQIRRALESLATIGDEYWSAIALIAISKKMRQAHRRQMIVGEALDAIGRMKNSLGKIPALTALSSCSLSPQQSEKAFAIAKELRCFDINICIALVKALPEPARSKIIDEVMVALKNPAAAPQSWRELAAFASILSSPEHIRDALSIISKMTDDYFRALALLAIAPLMSEPQKIRETFELAMKTAENVTTPLYRANLFGEIASLTSIPNIRETAFDRAVSAFDRICDDGSKAEALSIIAPGFSSNSQFMSLVERLRIVMKEVDRAKVVASVAHKLSAPDHVKVLFDAVSKFRGRRARQEGFSALAPKLSSDEHIGAVLTEIEQTKNEMIRTNMLCAIATTLTTRHFQRTLSIALDFNANEFRAVALGIALTTAPTRMDSINALNLLGRALAKLPRYQALYVLYASAEHTVFNDDAVFDKIYTSISDVTAWYP